MFQSKALLRVCHIMSADLWAGAEVQVATLCSYLVAQPEVSVSAVLFNEGRLAGELRRLGVDIGVIEEGRHTAAAIVRFAARFLREREIDVVHTHRYKDNILGTAAARLAGVPVIVRSVHGLIETAAGWARLKVSACEALDKIVLSRFAHRVIAVSSRTADALRDMGYPAASLVAIRNGVDARQIRAGRGRDDVRRELGIPPQALVVGTAGRLSPVKAQAALLRAGRLVLDERPDTRILIVGEGPLREELIAAARRLGIGHACVFAGARADVHDVVAAMDVFVLPSLHEGIPMALLEAMTLQRPVVATAVGGVQEVVTDRSNGLLVAAGDDRALAAACLELARDRDLARRIGEAARQTVQRRFSYEANGRAVLDLYRSAHTTAAMTSPGPSTLALCRALLRAPVVHAWRKMREALDSAIERRRMARIRREPGPVLAALRSAARVLIVCHGNIIRSPFAASLLAQGVSGHRRVSVLSAGLAAVPGRPPHPTAVELADARMVDLRTHAASPLAPDAVAASDAIFVMDVPQLVTMRRRFPEARSRTFLLTVLAVGTPLEIRDPYAGDESRFQACFEHISRAVQPIAEALSGATQQA